jgi:hypothetical protein
MSTYTAEIYKQITGAARPKPWAERTHEERLRARKLFLQTVCDSSDADDAAVDEFFRTIRAEVPSTRSEFSASEKDIA